MKNERSNSYIIWLFSTVGFLVLTHVLFQIPAPYKWIEAVWSAGDFITFAGTVTLGAIAVIQNTRANNINDKLLAINDRLLSLEYQKTIPIVDIKEIMNPEEEIKGFCLNNCINIGVNDSNVSFDSDNNYNASSSNDYAHILIIKNLKSTDIISIEPINLGYSTIFNNGDRIDSEVYNFRSFTNSLTADQSNAIIFSGIHYESPPCENAEEVIEKGYINAGIQINLTFYLTNSYGVKFRETIQLRIIYFPARGTNIFYPSVTDKKIIELREVSPNE